MQTQRKFAKLAARVITGCLLLGFTTLARAQSNSVRTLYASAANVPTNIPGIRTYADPPKGFNAVTASDLELATYGFPPRPDKQANPDQYALWERAMRAAKVRWNGELKPLHGGGNLMTASGSRLADAFEILEGDVFLVEINVLEASQTSSVFLEDITLQTYNSYTVSTPGILGDDAEWIVGRPIGGQGPGPDGVFALANTVAINFNSGVASNGNAKSYYPGSQAASTYNFSMTDDAGDQPTEIVYGQGGSGYEGFTSLLFTTEACAYSGGCTP